MGIFSFFQKKPTNTANLAKERLKIIVEHSRSQRSDGKRPDFLNKMRLEILEVVRKYVDIDIDDINTNIASSGDAEILELNIVLPDKVENVEIASADENANLVSNEDNKNQQNQQKNQEQANTNSANTRDSNKSKQSYGRNNSQNKQSRN